MELNLTGISPSLYPPAGEEALTMYLAKNKLDRKLANTTQNVEALHQLASSYFIDRDGTMRKLHEIQISTNAIKVSALSTHVYKEVCFHGGGGEQVSKTSRADRSGRYGGELT